VSTGRVYVSHDVLFDENVCPFSQLHPNVGSQLRTKILLLPPSLRNSHEGVLVDDHCANGANPSSESHDV
jgi:hypothetical protein